VVILLLKVWGNWASNGGYHVLFIELTAFFASFASRRGYQQSIKIYNPAPITNPKKGLSGNC
jgi:hypothetical protein